MPLVPGVRLGAYEIGSLIGSGGMGEVYRARDVRLGRDVAIKVLPAGLATESRGAGRLVRPNDRVEITVGPQICGVATQTV